MLEGPTSTGTCIGATRRRAGQGAYRRLVDLVRSRLAPPTTIRASARIRTPANPLDVAVSTSVASVLGAFGAALVPDVSAGSDVAAGGGVAPAARTV
jgi:hypothetical protein